MRFLLFLISVSCFGASTFSITERVGVNTTNYPVQIGRPFVDAEILHYPQAGLCADATCAGVTWLTTQADVKQRYASGHVKHAVVSFHIPTLAANSTLHFTFRDQAECRCGAGLSKSEMLDPRYDFDATMAFTNGIEATVSARSILASWDGATTGATGPVYYWAAGPVATTLMIADHRNLQTCNGRACSANDVGSDANKSLRPEFHVTFFPLTRQVKVRFVGGIVNTEAMQNQSFDLSLRVGSASPATVYGQTGLTLAAGARFTVWHNNQSGQAWTVSTPSGNISVEKETWIGGVPPAAAINHNLSYLVNTLFFPHYDTSKVFQEASSRAGGTIVTGLASSWSAYVAADRGINGNGWWWGSKAIGDLEASPLPRWTVMYLYSGDIRAQEMAYRATDLGAAFRTHLIEGRAGNRLLRGDASGSRTGVGRVLSITDRPYFRSGSWTYAGTQKRPQDDVTPVGVATNVGRWSINEIEHFPDRGSAEYVLSGDVFYLQEQLYAASYAMSFTNGAAINQNYGRGPTGAEGGVSGPDPRSMAWALRAAVMASYITPDRWPEKAYFDQLITDFVAIEEGARCTALDILPWCAASPRHGSVTWVWGYTYRRTVNGALGYPPLGQWFLGSNAFVQGTPSGGAYGINMAAGAGTASNSGLSKSITLSDSGACASVPVGTVVEVCATSSYASGRQATVSAKSCPTLTISAAINATGCTYWMYSPNVASATSQFSMDYMMYSWGRAVEMGYPFRNLLNTLAGYYAGLLTTEGVNPRLAFSGRTPTLDARTGQYFSTFTSLASGWHSSWQTFSDGYSPSGGNGPPTGYAARLQAAASFLPASSAPNGMAAWRWVAAAVSGNAGYTNDPTWALLPREKDRRVLPPGKR